MRYSLRRPITLETAVPRDNGQTMTTYPDWPRVQHRKYRHKLINVRTGVTCKLIKAFQALLINVNVANSFNHFQQLKFCRMPSCHILKCLRATTLETRGSQSAEFVRGGFVWPGWYALSGLQALAL